MKATAALVERNIKKYFRDKGVLLFSMLSVFIVAALYLFFLSKMQIDYVKQATGMAKGIEYLINSWVVGGLACIPAVSVPLIILCFRVDDVVLSTNYDLGVTPAKRIEIMLGYAVSAVIVGFVMSLIVLGAGEAFIAAKGGELLNIPSLLKVISVLLLINISFTGFELFIILFMRTNSSVSVANSILNVTLGFLLGLYVPVGMFGGTASDIIKSFPLIQGASIVRQIIMAGSMDIVFAGVPETAVKSVRQMYGIDIAIGSLELSNASIIIILLAFGVVFYSASLAVLKYRKEK
ncbi:MAG: ABC transporter permease [Clostridia bacterium]|nr:ABC transporter permease [Clostridia bacterium]